MSGISTYVRGKYVWIRLSPNTAERLELPEQFSTKLQPNQTQELQQLFKALNRRREASIIAPVAQVQFQTDAPNNLTWSQAFAKFTEHHSNSVSAKNLRLFSCVKKSVTISVTIIVTVFVSCTI